MKKALILALVVLFALGVVVASCGGTEETTTTTTAAPATTTTTAAPATTTTAAPQTTTTAQAQAPIEIKFATHYQETEPAGANVKKFCDYVTEKTNGAVTFSLFYGGTLGAPPEELDLVSSGSIGMTVLGHLGFADQLPLLNFCGFVPGKVQYDSASTQASVDYFNTLVFNDPTTSKLIQDEATAKNIKYLGFTAGGEDVFLAKFAFTSLADLKGKKFGNAGSQAAWEALGLTFVQAFPPDMYEDLQRGIVDCTEMGFAPTVLNKWYENAPYYMWDGIYAAGNPYTINLDIWNKLTPQTQQVFLDAGVECAKASVTDTDAQTTDLQKILTGAKVSLGSFSDADATAIYAAYFKANSDDMYARAQKAGIADNMATVLAASAKLVNQTWAPPAK
jgi:TRAP-type C4-dicarboxylate transport system substrate-binding protein